MHELAHALGLGDEQYDGEQAKLLVDCVIYIVVLADRGRYRWRVDPYIRGWEEDGALDAVPEDAETIDAIAPALSRPSASTATRLLPRAGKPVGAWAAC